jgi:hypothetical protein
MQNRSSDHDSIGGEAVELKGQPGEPALRCRDYEEITCCEHEGSGINDITDVYLA